MPLFTLGHSTLTAREFVTAARGIDVIVDVRSHPGSNHCPQFNREQMERWLPESGIRYEWWPGLGGWDTRHLAEWGDEMAAQGVDVASYARGAFPKNRIGRKRPPAAPNPSESTEKPVWTNQGLYDFAWFTAIPEFLGAIDQLIAAFGSRDGDRAALVCCEALWWKCHRSMIADHLAAREVPCWHLPSRPPKTVKPRFKLHADALGNRLERYPNEVLAQWTCWRLGLTPGRQAAIVG